MGRHGDSSARPLKEDETRTDFHHDSPFMNSGKHIERFFTNTLSRWRFLTPSAIAAVGTPTE
jgi:hypothetical protein